MAASICSAHNKMRKAETSDWIYLHGLRLKCHIGVSPRERRKKQSIIADIALKCDLRRAGQSDRLKDTLDYSVMAGTITALAAKRTFCLLESLAGQIAEIGLANSLVTEIIVKVSKSGVLPNIFSVSVEIHRKRRNRP